MVTRQDSKEVLLASCLIFVSCLLDPNRLLYSSHSLYKPLLFGGSSWPFFPSLPSYVFAKLCPIPSPYFPPFSVFLSFFLSTLHHVFYWTLASHLSSSISIFCLSFFFLMIPFSLSFCLSDLVEWMRRLSIELIRQSPSPIIRACATLAKVEISQYFTLLALLCILLHCTVLYCIVLVCYQIFFWCCSVLYCTALYCTALYCTALVLKFSENLFLQTNCLWFHFISFISLYPLILHDAS